MQYVDPSSDHAIGRLLGRVEMEEARCRDLEQKPEISAGELARVRIMRDQIEIDLNELDRLGTTAGIAQLGPIDDLWNRLTALLDTTDRILTRG